MPVIEFRNVTKMYGHSAACKGVNLAIEEGEFVSVVGQSGAGKTTLVKLLIAEEHVTEGRIVVADWDITHIRPREVPILRQQIGVVFQDFKLLDKKTVYENVAFALEVAGRSQHEIEGLVPQVLDMVGLGDKQHNFPHELSGGEKQRVAIARAMVHRPAVLIADEPTGNLDEENTEDIIKLISKINEFGTTVILATHNKHVVNLLHKRVIALADGKVVRDEEKSKYALE